MKKNLRKNLPTELTQLVDLTVTELGRMIQSELGPHGFQRIEKIRRYVKSSQGKTLEGLQQLKLELQGLSREERYQVAHSFSLMLELINCCEFAYRAERLQEEPPMSQENSVGSIIHVLTAHPTESRNPDILYYFRKIQNLLRVELKKPSDEHRLELFKLLKICWRLPMAKQRRPSVMDEAEYIYSLVLQKEIIEVFLAQSEEDQPFYIRTWVGGDKDGHPGVDEKTLLGSLQMSRGMLLKWVQKSLNRFVTDMKPLAHGSGREALPLRRLLNEAGKVRRHLLGVKKLRGGDAHRVQKLRESLEILRKKYQQIFAVESTELERIGRFLRIFPGLVVPLEIREDSDIVHDALAEKGGALNISRMLKALASLAPQHEPRFYVRGFVLSRCESAEDIQAGVHLAKKYLGQARLPVVPLFESASSLERGQDIIRKFLSSPARRKMIRDLWSNQMEVMLGYSDSAKENGSMASKVLIHEAIQGLEKIIQGFSMTPIFFHGSGGSVERGGGSIQDQIHWWPLSALSTVKVTVQGEMIYRTYAAPEILQRQLDRFEVARSQRLQKRIPREPAADTKALKAMAKAVQSSYQSILTEASFLEVIELATPYSYLKDVRLGSRPSKRQGAVDLNSLRAIPWVLCWTQTRALFPSWWGVGTFWAELSSTEKKNYKKLFKRSTLLASFVRLLGFTLAKMDLNVFALYLHSSRLAPELASSTEKRFRKEFALCQKAVREITGQNNLLWYRPWLLESIHLRSPLINPLSALQILAQEDHDHHLLRETVTGVASGMLTTG